MFHRDLMIITNEKSFSLFMHLFTYLFAYLLFHVTVKYSILALFFYILLYFLLYFCMHLPIFFCFFFLFWLFYYCCYFLKILAFVDPYPDPAFSEHPTGQTGIKQASDFLVCPSSENSPATKPNWSFKPFVNSKQTSNTPTTFE